ncbi:MAG: FAD:protein FMN transferase [Elusimicrobiota bacterium]
MSSDAGPLNKRPCCFTPLLAAAALACAQPAPTAVKLEGRTMGTSYHITLAETMPPDRQGRLKSDIDILLAAINKKMSTYDPESELSRFNRSISRQPFSVSPETLDVVRTARRIAEETRGAFDPTIGPLVDLWGFGPAARSKELPGDTAIAAARSHTGYRRLKTWDTPPALGKDISSLRVDLSAIAKGYGVDAVARLIKARGHQNFMVEIGGEVFAQGKNPRGRPWRIGIDTPHDGAPPGGQFSAFVSLHNAALATSGGYRNFYTRDGRRYAHFIDPRTGRPVEHGLASVSITAPTCMEADAAATAVMVLGAERGRGFIEEHPGWEALFISADEKGGFTVTSTPGFPRASGG